MSVRKAVIALMMIILVFPIAALAHKGATGQVKIRMDNMSAIAKATKSIGLMLAGKSDIDYSVIETNADLISGHAAKIPADFEMNMQSDVSEASPKIWLELDKFNAIAKDLELAAGLLNKHARERAPIEEMQVAFKSIGKTCSNCHADYRIKAGD